MKKSIAITLAWFASIALIASLLCSCATGYVQCDAYGQTAPTELDQS